MDEVSRETARRTAPATMRVRAHTQSMQPAAPMPARHCAHAMPALPMHTAPQAARAAAQEIFFQMLQPDASIAPLIGLVLMPRATVGA